MNSDASTRGRGWQRPLLGLALSAALVALLSTQVDWRESLQRLATIDPARLVLPIGLLLAALLLRPWRWQTIFPPTSRPTALRCQAVWNFSNLCNNLLPARGGDVLRCWLIARSANGGRTSTALATLGLEKVLDGLALLAILAFSFAYLTPPGWLQALTALAALLFGGALAAMLALHRRPRGVVRAILALFLRVRLPAAGRRVGRAVRHFAAGLGAVRSGPQMSLLAAQTMAAWLAEMALVWAAAGALGIPLSPADGAVVAAVLGLGLMIPAAPAFVGSYEFFCVQVLDKMFGIAPADALALALLMHALVLLVTTALGLLAWPLVALDARVTQPASRTGSVEPQAAQRMFVPVPRGDRAGQGVTS